MGLSIYYSGTLRSPGLIDQLMTEATDINESLHWAVTELPSTPGTFLRGLVLQPENCEPVWLTFQPNGKLCHPILYSCMLEVEDPKDIANAKQVLVTKTQHAGASVHMEIIKLMRYLSEKYFSEFELTDDSRFWETGDEQLCRKRFDDGGKAAKLLDEAYAEAEAEPGRKKEIFRKLRKKLKDEGYGALSY